MVNPVLSSFPVLFTERLTLRQLSEDDVQEIFKLRSDERINRYIDREPSKTLNDALQFIRKIIGNNGLYWVITLSDSKLFAGTVCLFNFSDESDTCEIGYELLTDFHGKGIMAEAVAKVIDYAFSTIRLKKIEAVTHKNNESSTKLLHKLNFQQTNAPNPGNTGFNVFSLSLHHETSA